jgi:hypothetical protein
MTNGIKSIRIFDARLDAAEADICISVYPENLTSTTQIRGRLTGPRCPYASTVEVAYGLREHSREYESTGYPHITMRAIIPEPNFWEPQTPFLYRGPVELWQKGQLCDTVQISHGLRTLEFGQRGLRVNGHPLILRGIFRSALSQAEARSLHQANYNTLMVPAGPELPHLREIGDRFGFLLLGQINSKADVKYNDPRIDHPSWLGWVVHGGLFHDELSRIALPTILSPMGIDVTEVPGELPAGSAFVTCDENLLPALGEIRLPKLVLRKGAASHNARSQELVELPDILGWIEE